MSELPKLNFPAINLRARPRGKQIEVWDNLRGIYLLLTPEEWVRQHLIAYLVAHCAAPAKRIVQEYAVGINGQPQRADVVVVDATGQPLLLAECKAPDIQLDQQVWAQATRYNSVVRARFVVLTNGMQHYCWEYRQGGYEQRTEFPDLGRL